MRKGFGTGAGRTEQLRAYHQALREAADEIDRLQEAAELVCGLLWMVHGRSDKVRVAYQALRNTLGWPDDSEGLAKAIRRAIAAGYEADHPAGADWWAGKKDNECER